MATHSRGVSTLKLQVLGRTMDRDAELQATTIIALPKSDYGTLTNKPAIASARQLLFKAAQDASSTSLVVDLTKVRFLGAEFVGLLASTAALLGKRRRRLVLYVPPQVHTVLEVCGFERMSNVTYIAGGL